MSQNSINMSIFDQMKKPLEKISYRGDLSLLDRPKVSIVGSRKPSQYTKRFTHEIAKALANRGVVVVSGAAMGVDAIAHSAAGVENTIAILPTGIDIRYPSVNEELIKNIEQRGLIMSQFDDGFRATSWSFVLRNEVVVALGDILVITEADEGSGSMRSAEYALQMGKDIYVLPHQLDHSKGTNALLRKSKAKPIYDVEEFASMFGDVVQSDIAKDEFYYFCQQSPTLDEALANFGSRIYEAELEGIIVIQDGRVILQ